jgi:hypothetical protein
MASAGSEKMGSEAQSANWLSRVVAWCRRKPLLTALSLCLVIETVAVCVIFFWQWVEIQHLRRELEELRNNPPVKTNR